MRALDRTYLKKYYEIDLLLHYYAFLFPFLSKKLEDNVGQVRNIGAHARSQILMRILDRSYKIAFASFFILLHFLLLFLSRKLFD